MTKTDIAILGNQKTRRKGKTMSERTFTQADIDAAIERTRSEVSAAASARYKDQSGTIDNLNKQLADIQKKHDETANNLKNANTELFKAKEEPAIKDMYSKLGGNDSFFNDFMTLHGEKFQQEGANKDAIFKTLTEENKHFFTEKAPTPEQVQAAKVAAEPIRGGEPAKTEQGRPATPGRRNPY